MATNPLRADPSRTAGVRRRWLADTRARLARLRSAVWQLVAVEDAFALRPPSGPLANDRWKFATDPDKLKAFRAWLQQQIDAGVLEVDGSGDPWTAQYVSSAYRQGVLRSYGDVRKEALAESVEGYAGSRAEFLRSSFGGGQRLSKVQALATRSYEDLKAVTSSMAAGMNRVLAEGLANGKGPREVASDLVGVMDGQPRSRALLIAKTELSYAQAEGQLDGFEDLGVEEVGLDAEWLTSGLPNVCAECAAMQGVVMPISEARGMIPLHPGCACAWTASLRDRPEKGQVRGKAAAAAVAKAKGEED